MRVTYNVEGQLAFATGAASNGRRGARLHFNLR